MKDAVDYYSGFSMNDGKSLVYCGYSGINSAWLVWRQDGNFMGSLLIHDTREDAKRDFGSRFEFAKETGALDDD